MAVDETQERLIATAERLFAKHGFDGVTLKQITTEAGQRNASALQYHFGSKVELVKAIIMRRMPHLNERRNAMLDVVEAEGRSGDLRAIVEAMVRPLAEQLESGRDGGYYVGFLVQAWTNPRSGLTSAVTQGQNSSVIRAGLMAGTAMGDLPSEIIQQRLSILTGIVLHSVADYQRFIRGDDRSAEGLALFIDGLVDGVVGMLLAPVSAATRRRLERRAAKSPAD